VVVNVTEKQEFLCYLPTMFVVIFGCLHFVVVDIVYCISTNIVSS
jgi:hypothetical protein